MAPIARPREEDTVPSKARTDTNLLMSCRKFDFQCKTKPKAAATAASIGISELNLASRYSSDEY